MKYNSCNEADNIRDLAVDIGEICNSLFPTLDGESKIITQAYKDLAKVQADLCEHLRSNKNEG